MIRQAKLSEIQEILSMTRSCGQKMIAEGVFQWNEHYPNIEAFQKDIKRNELFVFTSEEKIIGCIVISSEKDKEYDDISWLTPDGDNYYIHRLAVDPAQQGKGIARKLMDFAEAYVAKKNAVSVRLDTFSQNHRNQKFYRSRGYTQLGNIYFPKQSEFPFYCYELVFNP